ncbi:MAG: glycerophosphodiester phosphodiesterase [Woeseiaceae bacterium]
MRPVVIAHRGASGYLPEHTRPAKVLAHVMGADFLEQDIVATRDDELVVMHDVQIDTVTDVADKFPDRARADGRYYARDFDMAEIRQLTAWERMRTDGSAVYPQRYPAKTGHYRVHTFREELQLVNRLNAATGRNVGIYPEIKRPAWHKQEGVDISPIVLEQIHEFNGASNRDLVYVQCFDDAEVRRLKQDLKCEWQLVQLIGKNAWNEAATDYDQMRELEGLKEVAKVADGIGPNIDHLYINGDNGVQPSGLVEAAHSLSLVVHPYTFRSDDLPTDFGSFEELVQFCVTELGADGLFTDFPDQVIQIIGDMKIGANS